MLYSFPYYFLQDYPLKLQPYMLWNAWTLTIFILFYFSDFIFILFYIYFIFLLDDEEAYDTGVT